MSKHLWLDAYLVKLIKIKIPGTSRYIDLMPMTAIRIDPSTGIARIHAYEIQLNRLDYMVIC